ncbi:hypothetical protein C0J52_26431 [Blattella germanica]|nr:hypothetical protein C0J52_26431 [Blattella germanica]
MVRHVGQKPSDLYVDCFPGIRIEGLGHQMERQGKKEVETVILQVGTIDMRQPTDHIMEDMHDLGTAAKRLYPTAKIIISGVIRRRDLNWRQIGKVNEAFD